MKKFYLYFSSYVITLLFGAIATFSQVPDWAWATAPSPSPYTFKTHSLCNDVATDAQANTYITGVYHDQSITFGDFTLVNSNIYGGTSDIFIVKYDPSGEVLWARSANGTSHERSVAISTDKAGNVYVLGSFESSPLTFDIGDSSVTLQDAGGSIWFVKYDTNGNLLWVRTAEGISNESASDIDADKLGNIYITGNFTDSSMTFGSTILYNPDAESWNGYLAKYDTDGNALWAKLISGQPLQLAAHVIADDKGNIYLSGHHSSPLISFGEVTVEKDHIDGYDMVIVKYDTDGNVEWASSPDVKKDEPGYLDISAYSSATDNHGNVYVTGSFNSSAITFGTITINNTASGHPDGRFNTDVFVVKYDSEGNVLWVQSGNGVESDEPKDIAIDGNGNISITGYFKSNTIAFGGTTLEKRLPGVYDIFIVNYDASGNLRWTKSAGTRVENPTGLSSDMSGNLYLTGSFLDSTITFGNSIIRKDNSISPIRTSFFLAKLHSGVTSVTENISDIDNITIVPNPSQSTFNIPNIELGNWQITIYTIGGQSIYKSGITEIDPIIDLSGNAKGTYIYQLQKDNKIVKTGKLIID